MATAERAKQAGGNSFHTLTQRQIVGTMTGVMLTLLLAALDQTIVGTAMPRIIAQLNGFDRYAWVTTAYLLTSTAAVPIFGKLSDIYGRKWFYLAGAVLFVVASALCGAAGSIPGVPGGGMTQLIIFRGLQGVGGGIIMAITFTIIGDIFPPAVRGKYQGLLSAVWGMSSVFGPTLGGWITDSFSWRWIFYINLPVGILATLALFFAFPYFKPEGIKRVIDYVGVMTLLGGLVPLLLALTWVTDYGWGSPRVVGLLVVAVVMLVAFVLAETRAVEPILPLSLFRDRIIALSTITVFLNGMAMFAAILFIPLFMQTVIGVSATQSGSLLTPMMVIWSVGSISAGQFVARVGRYKGLVLFGLAIMTVGLLLLGRMGAGTSRLVVVGDMLLVGAGMGLTMPIFTLIVQNAAPQRQIGAATATVQFFRQIGGTVGAAVFGSIMLTRYKGHFDGAVPQGTPSAALTAFRNPLQLAQSLPQLKGQFAAFPNGAQLLQTLLANTKDALVYAITGVFLISMSLSVVAFVINFWLQEIPLRASFAPPETATAEAALAGAETPLGAPPSVAPAKATIEGAEEQRMTERQKPPRLQAGMTIGVVAPSSQIFERSVMHRGVAALEKLGFKVVFAPHARDRYGYLGGSDRDRADDLLALFFRDDVDAVICMRGGVGANRTANALDRDLLAQLKNRPPKPFIGFSDITVPHAIFAKELNWVTFYGPMIITFRRATEYTIAAFRRALMETEPFDILPDPDDPYVETMVPGVAEGELVGGCLQLLAALVGTPWEVETRGKILFFEDVHVPPYSIDRSLSQLIAAGKLQECAGIVIGEHTDCAPKNAPSLSLEQVFDDLIRPLGIPTLYHLPIGHGTHLATLPIGVQARLDATNKTLSILESGVQ